MGTDGNLYGVTNVGGASNNGTVFKITLPGGAVTTLYSFTGAADGANPTTGLVLATDGNFYGTTNAGGNSSGECAPGGCGTVFKITPGGALTTIYTFQFGNDGAFPYTPLLQAKNGNFYGINVFTIFEVTPGGVLTPISSNVDTNCSGCFANSLIQGANGDLYGTSAAGGTNGDGAIFQISFSAGGSPTVTIVYNFCSQPNCTDGSTPSGPLVLGTDGNFYGVASQGADANSDGGIFKLTPAFQLTMIYTFCSQMNCADGITPTGLMQASDGNFYGTTIYGGANNFGTIFKITSAGALTTLYNFQVQPFAPPQGSDNSSETYGGMVLVQDNSGNFYGTTSLGGANGNGSVYSLSLGLAITLVANAEGGVPLIAPNTWVEIKGSDLAPAGDSRIWKGSDFVGGQMPTSLDGVSVTVNGVPAYIYYISPTQVNVLTPPSALPASVQVVLTNGGVSSAAFSIAAQTESPSFFIFNGGPYVTATHANGSLIGPTTLYPGLSTPAAPGETIVLYANGFGATSVAITAGAETQSGTLSPLPVIMIGGMAATVNFAGLVAPGEFQFNVVVPSALTGGDQQITASYGGSSTQSGTLLTLQ